MSNPKWPQQPPFPPQPGAPGAPQGAFGAPQPQNPIAATQAMEIPAGGFPGMQGAPAPAPPAQPWGAPPAQGAPFGQPSQPQFGQPQAPQQGFGQPQFGGAPQAPQQGFGQPQFGGAPQAPQFGGASQQGFGQPQFGGAPQGFGQPQTAQPWGSAQGGYSAPTYNAPAPPSSTGGRSVLSLVGAGFVVALGVCAKVAIRAGGRRAVSAISSSTHSTTPRPTLSSLGTRTTTQRAMFPDERIQSKLDPYVEHCLNRFARQVFDAEGRYLQWVDREKGPSSRTRNIYGIYNVTGEVSECANATTQAATLTPSLPGVETAAQRYVTALNTVVPLVRQAHAYYSNPMTYRADDMAQGRLLHPQLLAAFDGFTAAQRALSDEVGRNQDEATDAYLARVRNDPTQVVEYHLKNDQRMGRMLVRMIRPWQITGGALLGIPTEQFVPLVGQYEQGLGNLRAAAIANPQQAVRIGGLASYQGYCQSYLTQLQRMAQRLQTGERFTRTDLRLMNMRMGYAVQGSPDAVNRAYNDAVQAYNRLR